MSSSAISTQRIPLPSTRLGILSRVRENLAVTEAVAAEQLAFEVATRDRFAAPPGFMPHCDCPVDGCTAQGVPVCERDDDGALIVDRNLNAKFRFVLKGDGRGGHAHVTASSTCSFVDSDRARCPARARAYARAVAFMSEQEARRDRLAARLHRVKVKIAAHEETAAHARAVWVGSVYGSLSRASTADLEQDVKGAASAGATRRLKTFLATLTARRDALAADLAEAVSLSASAEAYITDVLAPSCAASHGTLDAYLDAYADYDL